MLPLYCHEEFNNATLDALLPLQCLTCGETFYRSKRKILRVMNNPNSRDTLDFCGRSCAAKFLNTFSRHRSKFEIFTEEYLNRNLPEYLPNFPILYNVRDLFLDEPHEVDIYCPTIKVAIEINGLHHYEPIFSQERFDETLKNDNAVASCCYKEGIRLVVLNTSEMQHFSKRKGEQYAKALLHIIVELHDEYERLKSTNPQYVNGLYR